MDNNNMFGENGENTTGENNTGESSVEKDSIVTETQPDYTYGSETQTEQQNTPNPYASPYEGVYSSSSAGVQGDNNQSGQYAYESQINQGISYGNSIPNGSDTSYSNNAANGSSMSYGNNNAYGNNSTYGNGSSYGNGASYGNGSSYGNGTSYGSGTAYGNSSSYGNDAAYGNNNAGYGNNSSYNNNNYGNNTYNNGNQNSGAPNYYAPNYNNMQNNPNSGYQGYEPELEEPVKMGEWMLLLCLATFIPCVGLILAIVWAFSKTEKKSKVNFCKAYLVVCLIKLALFLVLMFIYGGVLVALLSGY